MAFPNSDCECVQGIEYFIDPRHYTPWEENGGIAHIELPWWYRKQIEAVNKRIQEEAKASEEAAQTETSTSQRTITLIVKGTSLINHGFIHLVAHQIKSFWVSLETMDEDWLKCDISLQFTHVESGGSVLVPLLGTGAQFKVAIPSEVLLPGTLLITAIGTVKLGDYQVLSTESLKLRVYDPVIPPIKWPTLKSYDVYFEYQRMMKSILAEVEFLTNDAIKAIRDNEKGIELVWGVTDSDGVLCAEVKTAVVPLVHRDTEGKLLDKDDVELLTAPLRFTLTDATPLTMPSLSVKTNFKTEINGEEVGVYPRTIAENVEVGPSELLSERLEAIKTDLEGVHTKLDELTSLTTDHTGQIEGLKSTLLTAENNIIALQNDVKQLKTRLDKVEAALKL